MNFALGYSCLIEDKEERIFSIETEGRKIFVNGIHKSKVKPIKLSDDVFDALGFGFANGWVIPPLVDDDRPTLKFFKDGNVYRLVIGVHEVEHFSIRYLHELQRVIHVFRGETI